MVELPAPFDLLPILLRGALFTIELTLMSAALGIVVAFIAGLARLSRFWPVRFATAAYVETFRGSSALVQIFYFFYVLPLFGLNLPPIAAGVLALGLNTGAYGSEIVRGSVLAVERGQREAAVALNMPGHVTMRRVILPQAIVAMLPPFTNLMIELLKGTSLVSLITLTELAFTGRLLLVSEARPAEIFSLVLLLYFVMAWILTRCLRWVEARASRGLRLGPAR